MLRHSLLVLSLLVSTASAQPGATEPQPPPPPPGQPQPLPPTPGQPPPAQPQDQPAQAPILVTRPDGQRDIDLDAAVARVEAAMPTIENVARGAFRRLRRSISIGPTVGVWGLGVIDTSDIDGALTFGLGFEKFKVPIMPSMDTIKAMIKERVKAQVKERIKAALKGQLEPINLETMVAQVYTEVRDEILGVKEVRAKTMERPALSIGLEANRVFGAERWLGRLRAGVGVWKFTVAASLAVGRVCRSVTCDDGVKLFVGPEVVMHFLMSKKPRASVLDVFVRFDIQTTSRGDEVYDQVALGARYLLDIF